MSLANSQRKKRKRTSQSPVSLSTRPAKLVESSPNQPSQQSDMAQEKPQGMSKVQAVFQSLLKDDKNEIFNKYDRNRKALLEEELRGAWDYDALRTSSSDERKAATIIRSLREYERRVVFGNNASEAIPGPDTRDMGGQFLTNLAWIERRSKLFTIATEVPKGALLHLHFNAELNPERLLGEAKGKDNMYVWSKRALLSDKDLEETEIVFDVLPSFVNSTDIFSPAYKGVDDNGVEIWKEEKRRAQSPQGAKTPFRAYMKWTEFQSSFKKRFPTVYDQDPEDVKNKGSRTASEPQDVKLEPAENWIKRKMVLSEAEAYSPSQTVNGVWARFNQATRCFKGLFNYKKVYEWYIGKAIDRLIDEKIMYAELRPMLMDKAIPDTDGVEMLGLSEQMRLLTKCVKEKLEETIQIEENGKKIPKKKKDVFPFGFKIIYCTPRSIPKAKMQSEMLDCIRLHLEFPDLICGFDLVGAEDRPNHIGFYKQELVAFKEACRQLNIDIPFMFHAGETLLDTGGSADPANSNLFDAVALGSKRIGHGFSLLKHPQLVQKFKKTENSPGICIELCPISNELLHLCRNIKEHPYPELLAAGIPCCVNSDNPSLFGNSMSHEFYQIMVGSPTMSLHSWKQLAQWSLEYSCLSENDKAKAQDVFMQSFEMFCKKVVREYGRLVDLEHGRVHRHNIRSVYDHRHPNEKDRAAEEARHVAFFS